VALASGATRWLGCEKFNKPFHLEEGEVVTRYPSTTTTTTFALKKRMRKQYR
jgi:hypothetical protein